MSEKKNKLTAKQKRFCEEYMVDGNATQAAIRAGYSFKTARTIGAENLAKPAIKEHIDALLAEIESAKIADAREVLEFYTRVLRGEEKEEVVLGTELGIEKTEKGPALKDRMSAAREIMKRYPLAGSDPLLAEQLRKVKAEADIIERRRDDMLGMTDETGADEEQADLMAAIDKGLSEVWSGEDDDDKT